MLDKVKFETSSEELSKLKIEEYATNIDETINDLILNIEDILSFDNISLVKNFFDQLGFKNYYDFYFCEVKKIREIFAQNELLNKFFNKIIGVEKIDNGNITRNYILLFAEFLGYTEPYITEVRDIIVLKLKDNGITSLNEFELFPINEFKDIFNLDDNMRYFCSKKLENTFSRINYDDYIKLGKKLGLKYLEPDIFTSKLSDELKSKGINYMDDLNILSINDFRDLMGSSLLFKSYLLLNNLDRNILDTNDKKNFGYHVGLGSITKKESIEFALKRCKINHYYDLESMGYDNVKSFLWSEPLFKGVLKSFGLEYLKDFRIDYLIRFSRHVGLNGTPKKNEYNEQDIKSTIIKYLLKNGINCKYSIKFRGIKPFKRIFTQEYLGIQYSNVNLYIINKTGKSINKLLYEDLDTISDGLGLKELSEAEHKYELLQFLFSISERVDRLNKSKVSSKLFWDNSHLRYFIHILGLGDNYKSLSPEDIEKLKKYILDI